MRSMRAAQWMTAVAPRNAGRDSSLSARSATKLTTGVLSLALLGSPVTKKRKKEKVGKSFYKLEYS